MFNYIEFVWASARLRALQGGGLPLGALDAWKPVPVTPAPPRVERVVPPIPVPPNTEWAEEWGDDWGSDWQSAPTPEPPAPAPTAPAPEQPPASVLEQSPAPR